MINQFVITFQLENFAAPAGYTFKLQVLPLSRDNTPAKRGGTVKQGQYVQPVHHIQGHS